MVSSPRPHRAAAWFVALPAIACSDPRDDDLTPPLAWLVDHVGDDDDDLAARVERLEALARTSFDPDGSRDDRTFDPGAREASAATGAAGVAAVHRSEEEIEDHLLLTAERNRVCIEGAAWDAWWRSWTSGESCLPVGGCREALTREVAREVADDRLVWQTSSVTWRRVELADEREAIVAVGVLESAVTDAPGDGPRLRDHVGVWVVDADDDGFTWRIDALWGQWLTDGVAPADLQRRLADDLHSRFEQTDAWLTGVPSCTHDRDAAPPPP